MELMRDVSSGGWLLERVGDWARVGGVAGTGFEAYARILHPVPVHRGDDEEESRWPWSEVARREGCTMHPLVQWNRLADLHQGLDFADGWSVGQVPEGFLELDILAHLTGHLAAATSSPNDLVAGFWEGSGELSGAGVPYLTGWGPRAWLARRWHQGTVERQGHADGPLLRWPERAMILFATSVDELADPGWAVRAGLQQEWEEDGLSPQLIWPRDREWVVATEIDWDSTIVAGSRSLVEAVLADDRLESYEVDEDSDLTWEGDLINPPRDGWPEEL